MRPSPRASGRTAGARPRPAPGPAGLCRAAACGPPSVAASRRAAARRARRSPPRARRARLAARRASPAPAATPRRLRERRRVGRSAGQSPPDEVPLGEGHRGATRQAQAVVTATRDGALAVVVDVVDRPDGLVVRREVALGVGGAPPEDVPGAPRATRDELAIAVLGTGDLERQLVRRRRTLTLDVVAVGVAGAAQERPEPAALGRQRPFAA